MSLAEASIRSEGVPIDQKWDLLSLEVRREVNRIPTARLVFIDGDAAKGEYALSNTNLFKPGAQVEARLKYTNDPSLGSANFKGVVVRHGVEADENSSRLMVEVKDAAVRLTQGRRWRVFKKQSDRDIFSKILSEAGLMKGQIETTSPVHEEIVQHHCTDWDFLLSRADALGLLVVVEDGRFSASPPKIGGSAKYKFAYGSDEVYAFEMEIDAGHQCSAVQSFAWSTKDKKVAQGTGSAFTLSQGNLKPDATAKAIGFKEVALRHSASLHPAELKAWASARLARTRLSFLRGRLVVAGNPAIKLLDTVALDGISDRFNGKTIVTGLRHTLDTLGWQTDIQFGLSADGFSREPFIQEAPASGLLPAASGLQVGVVTGIRDDPEKAFRVKIRLPAMDSEGQELWARVASLDAGENRGVFFYPEIDDEVLIGFLNDDPRQPVVLGSFYGPRGKPPSEFAALAKDKFETGIVTRKGIKLRFVDADKPSLVIESPAGNKVVLDDEAKSIKITDANSNSITLDKDGITLKSSKNLVLDASQNVEIKGSKVDVK